jgi:hypothetical protein
MINKSSEKQKQIFSNIVFLSKWNLDLKFFKIYSKQINIYNILYIYINNFILFYSY